MTRNIEIKARASDPRRLAERAGALCSGPPRTLLQDDTFFACAQGGLKLRVQQGDQAELIFYQRQDAAGPKASHYHRAPVWGQDTLRSNLALALGELGRVRKQRRLFLAGRTRIHLDAVEGLGHFVELEVVLAKDEPEAAGIAEVQRLMHHLQIEPGDLVKGAYIDLLAAGPQPDR